MRVYLDTAPVIYSVQQVTPYAQKVNTWFAAGSHILITSDLTRLECRVKPLRDRNTIVLNDFDTFFSETIDEFIALARDVMDRATELRAHYRIPTADAIHVAAAMVGRCDLFLTNDHRLGRLNEIAVEVIEQ